MPQGTDSPPAPTTNRHRARKAANTDLVTELNNNLAASAKRDEALAQESQGNGAQAKALRTEAEDIEAHNQEPRAGVPRTDLALAGLISLVGFTIGRMDAGRCRLYLSYQMDEFVEFSDEDVMAHRPIAPSQDAPLGGVVMWLRRGANVVYTRVSSQQVQAELLSGAIAQEHQTGPDGNGTNGDNADGNIGGYIGGYVGGHVGGNGHGGNGGGSGGPIRFSFTLSPIC